MKLNHLNLTVTDVAEASQFLEKYFGLRSIGKKGKAMAFLLDDDGLLLSLTSMKMSKETEVKYPASFHIGFMQESEEKVNEINRRLKDDGFAVDPPQRLHGYTFYFQAPGGFTVEVLC
jgi:lactoylglutathione lyase